MPALAFLAGDEGALCDGSGTSGVMRGSEHIGPCAGSCSAPKGGLVTALRICLDREHGFPCCHFNLIAIEIDDIDPLPVSC